MVKFKEDIKLICEFMELPYDSDFTYSSWNHIMPVVERIEEEESVASFEISNNGIYIYSSTESENFEDIEIQVIGKKIDCVYDACLKFIKWYNQNGNREK